MVKVKVSGFRVHITIAGKKLSLIKSSGRKLAIIEVHHLHKLKQNNPLNQSECRGSCENLAVFLISQILKGFLKT